MSCTEKEKKKRPIILSNKSVKKVKNSIKLSRMKKLKPELELELELEKIWTIDARVRTCKWNLEKIENIKPVKLRRICDKKSKS